VGCCVLKKTRASWLFVHPLVECVLITLARNHLGLRVDVSGSSVVSRAAQFALALSVVSAFPGLVLDYCTFTMPLSFLFIWLACAYVTNFTVALALFYGDNGRPAAAAASSSQPAKKAH